MVCATRKGSDQPAHMRSLVRAVASPIFKLLTEHHLEFLSLKGGCTGSSESTLVKIPHCWKSHVAAQLCKIHSFFSVVHFRYPDVAVRQVVIFTDVLLCFHLIKLD